MFQEIMPVNLFYKVQQYEAIYIESVLANILENEARMDSTTPVNPNPSLPRTALKLARVTNHDDPTKPIPLQHYLPVNLQISLDILSADAVTTEGLSDRYLAVSVRFQKELWAPHDIALPCWLGLPTLTEYPPAALWSSYQLSPSIQNLKRTNIKDFTINIPVEQLQYQISHDDPYQLDEPRQFYPDERGYISTVIPPKFPQEMNVDFSPTQQRNLDNLYNQFEDHFQDLTFDVPPTRELRAREPHNPHTRILRSRGHPLSKEQFDHITSITSTYVDNHPTEVITPESAAQPGTTQPTISSEQAPPTLGLSTAITEGTLPGLTITPVTPSLDDSAADSLGSPSALLNTSKSTGLTATTIDLDITDTSFDRELRNIQNSSGSNPLDEDDDTFQVPQGLTLTTIEPPKTSEGVKTRLAKKAEDLSEEHSQFLSQLLKHVNLIPQESITMSFLEPLVQFDKETKQFVQDPTMATSHNIQALDKLIELDAKKKDTLFSHVGKDFFTTLGKIIKQFQRINKD